MDRERATVGIADGGSAPIATGQPATVAIGDDTTWWHSGRAAVKRLLTFTEAEVRPPRGRGRRFAR